MDSRVVFQLKFISAYIYNILKCESSKKQWSWTSLQKRSKLTTKCYMNHTASNKEASDI